MEPTNSDPANFEATNLSIGLPSQPVSCEGQFEGNGGITGFAKGCHAQKESFAGALAFLETESFSVAQSEAKQKKTSKNGVPMRPMGEDPG